MRLKRHVSISEICPGPQKNSSAWYNQVHVAHRREVAPFFARLADEFTIDELAFYIAMEEQVDGRFDDVIALAQLGMSGDMKLALAENYWDEMGLGIESEMHTILFRNSADTSPRVRRPGSAQS